MIELRGPISVKAFESVEGGLEIDIATAIDAASFGVSHHEALVITRDKINLANPKLASAEIVRGNVLVTLPWFKLSPR